MRTEWIVILTVYAVVLPILTGWAALRVTRQTIESDTFDRLQASTKSVREAVDTGVQHNQDRLKDVVRLVDTGCAVSGVMNSDCVRDELDALVKSGASTATLRFAKRKGKWTVISEGQEVVAECPTQTCVWRNQDRKKTYYTLMQEDTHSGMVLSVAWPLEPLLKNGLDVSDSAALVKIGPTQWEVIGLPDATRLIPMVELETCANSGRGAPFVNSDSASYRVLAPMPAMPGVCVASFVPSSVVMKQDRLNSAMLRIVMVFVAVSLVLALLISLASTRAIRELRDRMKRLKEGDEYTAIHKHHGPAEVRELSITFDRMVHSLRRSQAALKESEQKLSMAYHAARVWVWEHHIKSGKIEVINPSSKEDVGTRSLRQFLREVHADDRRAVLAAIRMALQSGVYRVEFRVRRDGDYLWASSWGQMVEGGEVLMGVTADVTTVKEGERLRAERERLMATTEMSASLAHEINNPLAAVTGSLYMAERLDIADEELKHYLEIASIEARRIADIVKRLMQVHRSSSAPVPFDVVKLWSEVIEGNAENLQRNGYNVQMNASGPASVVGYIDELKFGFNNLLSNAMESSSRGSTIRVRIRPAYSMRSGLKGVRVVLCDEGSGIPQAKVKEMFKPFATTKSEKGRGLGLWVTRAAVLKQGGDISIRELRMPSHGTCVRIFLPNRPGA
jgi:signal transduction histidine kinase/HAMP domain-containing protein